MMRTAKLYKQTLSFLALKTNVSTVVVILLLTIIGRSVEYLSARKNINAVSVPNSRRPNAAIKPTVFFLAGSDVNCRGQFNHVCRFWYYIRCVVLARVSRVIVLPIEKNKIETVLHQAIPNDIIIFHWRSGNHSAVPPHLQHMLSARKFRSLNSTDIRVGVLHTANEKDRLNWPWYNQIDFVLRNYWINHDLPPHVQYIPLGGQYPDACEPDRIHPNSFEIDNPVCSCGKIFSQKASKRPFLWSFSGSLRRNRVSLLKVLDSSVDLRTRGFKDISKTFGGDGSYGSKNKSTNPKTKYLELIRNSAFVFCPCGNVMETHRIYEVLILGAIPVIENCEPHQSDFFPFQSLLFNGPREMVAFVTKYLNQPRELDQLQSSVQNWWSKYELEIGRNVSNVVYRTIERRHSTGN